MSNIQQTLYFDSVSLFPPTGAENVVYVAEDEEYGLSYYWDSGAGIYKKLLGDVLEFPIAIDNYPDQDTVGEAIRFLYLNTLAVQFNITPTEVYQSGAYVVDFVWITTRKVDDLESVVITEPNGVLPDTGDLKQYMTGNYGAKSFSLLIGTDVVFTITVTDKEGTVVTRTATLSLTEQTISIDVFDVDPVFWNESSVNLTDIKLNWALSLVKASIMELTLSINGGTATDVLTSYTNDDGTGEITFVDQDPDANITYTLLAKVLANIVTENVVFQFIPYVDLAYITPPSTTATFHDGSLTVFPFKATLNKNSDDFISIGASHAWLYQLVAAGGAEMDASSGDFKLGAHVEVGQNYVDLESYLSGDELDTGTALAFTFGTVDAFFKIDIKEENTFGMTSNASGEVSSEYSSDVEISTISMSPVEGYLDTGTRPYTLVAAFSTVPIFTNVEYVKLIFYRAGLVAFEEVISTFENDFDTGLKRLTYVFEKSFTGSGEPLPQGYSAILEYKEIGEFAVESPETEMYTVVKKITIDLNSVVPDQGTVYNVVGTFNRLVTVGDNTLAVRWRYTYDINPPEDWITISKGAGPSDYILGESGGVSTITFDADLVESSGSCLFEIEVTEYLGANSANSGDPELSSIGTDTETVPLGNNPVYWGVYFPPPPEPANKYALDTDTYINPAVDGSVNSQITEAVNPVTVNWYVEFYNNSLPTLEGFFWVAFPQVSPPYVDYNHHRNAGSGSFVDMFDIANGGFFLEDGVDGMNTDITIGSVAYKLYVTKYAPPVNLDLKYIP